MGADLAFTTISAPTRITTQPATPNRSRGMFMRNNLTIDFSFLNQAYPFSFYRHCTGVDRFSIQNAQIKATVIDAAVTYSKDIGLPSLSYYFLFFIIYSDTKTGNFG